MKFLALAAIAIALSGCLSCEPLLEVRNCLDHQCEPSANAVAVAWNAQHAADWPEVDRLLRATPAGEHEHAAWTEAKESAFWNAFGVSGDEPELIVTTDDGRFRVRILTCA